MATLNSATISTIAKLTIRSTRMAKKKLTEWCWRFEPPTQEASLAMTDVADAASEQIVDAFYIALGANVVDKLTERSSQVRSNFAQITDAIRQTPLDLRKGSLPGKKAPKQISGLWG